MGLIRNKEAAAMLRDAVVLDLGDIAGQADAIRRKAREDADEILREARSQAEGVLADKQDEGYRAGYEKGHEAEFAAGRDEGRRQAISQMSDSIEQALGAWTDALNLFSACRENLQTEARHDVLCLALEIAERIVYRVVEQDPTVIEDQMAETLQLLAERTAVVIHVHPDDLETARAILPTLIERIENCADAALVPDEAVSRGGCRLRAGQGEIDARIETQIERIVRMLLPDAEDRASANDSATERHHQNEVASRDAGLSANEFSSSNRAEADTSGVPGAEDAGDPRFSADESAHEPDDETDQVNE